VKARAATPIALLFIASLAVVVLVAMPGRSPAGARVFDASTFAWADGFGPPGTAVGVSVASFERFNRNLLAWLGFPVPTATGPSGQAVG
jgi:hypothetical protein